MQNKTAYEVKAKKNFKKVEYNRYHKSCKIKR